MKTLSNDILELRVSPNGREIGIVDRKRRARWNLDPSLQRAWILPDGGKTLEPWPLPPGLVEASADAITITHVLPQGTVRYRWTLGPDHVRVELEAAPDGISRISLPGPFRPAEGKASLLLPPYQGVLYRPRGHFWEDARSPGAHGSYSLSMAALLGAKGGLLLAQETITDWCGVAGETEAGPYVELAQARCPVDGWYRREVRLYPVDSDITAAAKRYRARIIERGEFVSWEEKIARKPIVKNLFGAMMAFIGYNKSPEVDYVASARKLREMGFETVLYYPVRMCNYSLGFLMGGDQPIWLSDAEIAAMKAVPGALVAPWGWFVEGLDDGSERMARIYRRNAKGEPYNGWRIEQQQWKLVCIPYQVEESKQRFATDMREMDWIHYDVNATSLGKATCYNRDHALHDGRPLSKTADTEWTRRLLGPETNGNRIVSSEGFIDRYAVSYDIGTTKLMPGCEPYEDFIPVPLTMLVLHDSMVHDWWEIHNYNQHPGWPASHNNLWGVTGCGAAPKKAAMDALYGSPPNLFPFGRQYGWVDIGSRRTFSYCIQLADREVQKALEAALPVTRLNRRIGPLELKSFEFVTEDGAVQSTVFADGTRIVSNLSDRDRDAVPYGRLAANSWRELRED